MKNLTPELIYEEAYRAGMRALNECTPVPMIVSQPSNPLDDNSVAIKRYYVSDGVCGFASVIIKPATGKFVNYLKAHNLGHKHYYGGYAYYVGVGNQSLTKKEAFANAFCEVLRLNGINCYVDSRMD